MLAQELAKAKGAKDVNGALMRYATRRFLRTGAIHGLSRMASIMNTTYKRSLGSDPYDFYPQPVKEMWKKVEKLEIPHPGRVVGQVSPPRPPHPLPSHRPPEINPQSARCAAASAGHTCS